MPTYYFMVGIPASGKSTHAASLGCTVICPDEIRREHPDWSGDRVFELARALVSEVLLAGRDVALDATATIRCWRTRDIAAGKPYANRVVCIWMDTPLEICLRRNSQRIQRDNCVRVPPHEIERMYRNLAMNIPDLSEGFDEIVQVTTAS